VVAAVSNRDRVALVLAAAVALAVVGAFTAVIVNIVGNQPEPVATLGENTTQVLTGLVGGIIGVLGAYIGHRDRENQQ
jgi:phosphotransferase system  glucose/maltose/N-acetylglucosamine-specific IIC component